LRGAIDSSKGAVRDDLDGSKEILSMVNPMEDSHSSLRMVVKSRGGQSSKQQRVMLKNQL